MMQHLVKIALACVFTAGLGTAQAADYNFKPGLWETTTVTEMKGMPKGMPGMPGNQRHTERHCVRESDIDFVPKAGKPQNDCKMTQHRVSRNKMRWTVRCNHQGVISEGKGEVVFSGTSNHGTFEMTMNGSPMGPMVMKHTFTSKRIGDCK
jgi:hypothetical protein